MVAHANLYDICMRFLHLCTRLTTAVNFSFFFCLPTGIRYIVFFFRLFYFVICRFV